MMTWWCLDPQIFLLKSNHLLTIFIVFFSQKHGSTKPCSHNACKACQACCKGGRGEGGRGRGEEGKEEGGKKW